MLVNISDVLFRGQQQSLPATLGGKKVRRPGPVEIKQMARAIGQRYGEDQEEAAQNMITMMTDVLFGCEDPRVSKQMVSVSASQPSPRTIQSITQRVVQRTGSRIKEEAVRQMLTLLTQALFVQSTPSNSPPAPGSSVGGSARLRDDASARGAASSRASASVRRGQGSGGSAGGRQAPSALTAENLQPMAGSARSGEGPPTARSSVRSRSTCSEDVKQAVNQEVRCLLTELCGVLFMGPSSS